MERRCDKCEYWQTYLYEKRGYCYRYPTKQYRVDDIGTGGVSYIISEMTDTEGDHWCGEFKVKDIPIDHNHILNQRLNVKIKERLIAHGIMTIQQLSRVALHDLKSIKGITQNSIKQIGKVLESKGLKLKLRCNVSEE